MYFITNLPYYLLTYQIIISFNVATVIISILIVFGNTSAKLTITILLPSNYIITGILIYLFVYTSE